MIKNDFKIVDEEQSKAEVSVWKTRLRDKTIRREYFNICARRLYQWRYWG